MNNKTPFHKLAEQLDALVHEYNNTEITTSYQDGFTGEWVPVVSGK